MDQRQREKLIETIRRMTEINMGLRPEDDKREQTRARIKADQDWRARSPEWLEAQRARQARQDAVWNGHSALLREEVAKADLRGARNYWRRVFIGAATGILMILGGTVLASINELVAIDTGPLCGGLCTVGAVGTVGLFLWVMFSSDDGATPSPSKAARKLAEAKAETRKATAVADAAREDEDRAEAALRQAEADRVLREFGS